MSAGVGSPGRHLILVAGAGRSGTSLVTGLLGRLGVRIPVPEVTADASNPAGFGEPRWAVDFHNRLLERANVAPEDGRPEAWELMRAACERPAAHRSLSEWLADQLGASDRVVVKDPRLTWFLPLYEAVAEELGAQPAVLTMLRHPAESVRSRELAYGSRTTATTRTASWLNMMLGTERRSRHLPRVFVSYDALLADWHTQLARAEERLGVPLLGPAAPDQVEEAGGLVDPGLRRAEAAWSGLGVPDAVQGLADRAYEGLCGVRDEDSEASRTTLDGLRESFERMYDEAAELTRARVRAARVEERRRARADSGRKAETNGAPSSPPSRVRRLLSRARRR
jgi:hypothetical protein